jgi:hypothetical protein
VQPIAGGSYLILRVNPQKESLEDQIFKFCG